MTTKITAANFDVEHDGKQYTASIDWGVDAGGVAIGLDALYNHTDGTAEPVMGKTSEVNMAILQAIWEEFIGPQAG